MMGPEGMPMMGPEGMPMMGLGGMPMMGAEGAPGMKGQAKAPPPRISKLRLIMLTPDGHFATPPIPLDFTMVDKDKWVELVVPLDKFKASLDLRSKTVEKIALCGDVEEHFWLGELKLVEEDEPLYADAGKDRTVKVGEDVKFHAADQRGNFPARYLWDFDALDGPFEEEDIGQDVTWKFPEAGFYTVTLRVEDPEGKRVPQVDKVLVNVKE